MIFLPQETVIGLMVIVGSVGFGAERLLSYLVWRFTTPKSKRTWAKHLVAWLNLLLSIFLFLFAFYIYQTITMGID